MRVMLWASRSCRSRAIRSRSSATRRAASSSRVRSARSARPTTAATYLRWMRTASPVSATATTQPPLRSMSVAACWSGVADITPTMIATTAATVRYVRGGGPATASE